MQTGNLVQGWILRIFHSLLSFIPSFLSSSPPYSFFSPFPSLSFILYLFSFTFSLSLWLSFSPAPSPLIYSGSLVACISFPPFQLCLSNLFSPSQSTPPWSHLAPQFWYSMCINVPKTSISNPDLFPDVQTNVYSFLFYFLLHRCPVNNYIKTHLK